MDGVCLKCFKKKSLTKHHVLPRMYFGENNFVILICDKCHRELESIIPKHQKLNKDFYLDTNEVWLKGLSFVVETKKSTRLIVGGRKWKKQYMPAKHA